MSKLITQDLISGIDWLKSCPPSWKDKAYTDLKNKLGRIWTEMPEAAKKGIELEATLNKAVNGEIIDLKASEEFKILMNIVTGYEQQKKTKSYITINDVEYCLYGKIDYYTPTHMIDLKSTSNYKSSDKYLKTFQHKIYCYNEKIKFFSYVIAEFENDNSKKIKQIYDVEYSVPNNDFESLKIEIENKIKEVISFLKMDDMLWTLYNTTYSRY